MLSRRAWIGGLLGVPVALGADRRAAAQTSGKVSQATAHYQDMPKAGAMCAMCKFFIPAGGRAGQGMMGPGMMGHGMMSGHMGPEMMQMGTCQVVEGAISPHGWCMLYTPIGS